MQSLESGPHRPRHSWATVWLLQTCILFTQGHAASGFSLWLLFPAGLICTVIFRSRVPSQQAPSSARRPRAAGASGGRPGFLPHGQTLRSSSHHKCRLQGHPHLHSRLSQLGHLCTDPLGPTESFVKNHTHIRTVHWTLLVASQMSFLVDTFPS